MDLGALILGTIVGGIAGATMMVLGEGHIARIRSSSLGEKTLGWVGLAVLTTMCGLMAVAAGCGMYEQKGNWKLVLAVAGLVWLAGVVTSLLRQAGRPADKETNAKIEEE